MMEKWLKVVVIGLAIVVAGYLVVVAASLLLFFWGMR